MTPSRRHLTARWAASGENLRHKTSLSLLILAPVLSIGLFAQGAPKLELFGGYSYFGLPREEASGLTAANLNGWNASVKLNVRPRIGVVADFSGNYGERRMVPTQFQPRETRPGAFRQHTTLYGPEVRAFTNDRFTVNIRALLGAAYIDTLVLPLQEPFQPPPITGIPQATVTEFRLGGEKPITGAFGGSLDYRISDRLYYRIQPELVVVHLGSTNDMNLRLSTGIVFTFGRL